jgi:hypothetical protein
MLVTDNSSNTVATILSPNQFTTSELNGNTPLPLPGTARNIQVILDFKGNAAYTVSSTPSVVFSEFNG